MSVATAGRFHDRIEALANTTTARLTRAWLASTAAADAEAAWFEVARPLVRAAATQAAGLAAAYARASYPNSDLGQVSGLIIPDAVARTQDPWGRVWRGLAEQEPWDAATNSAGGVVAAVADDATAGVARDTTADILAPLRLQWGRRLNAGACKWCMSMASYTWPTAHEASFGHTRCRCTPVPVDDLGDHNDTVTAAAGWDRQAEKAYRKRHQVARLRESEDVAKRRSREAAEQLRTERDPDRRERLSQREQDWETRAERAAEKRRILETGSHRLAA